VRAGYHAIAEAEPRRVRVVDASGSIDDVGRAVDALVAATGRRR
jgi:thymidylate kinase